VAWPLHCRGQNVNPAPEPVAPKLPRPGHAARYHAGSDRRDRPLRQTAGNRCPSNKRSLTTMMNLIRNFVSDEKGEDLIEYGLLAAFVAALGVIVAYTLGLDDAICAAFQRAIDSLGTTG